jgi:hypothetical protein
MNEGWGWYFSSPRHESKPRLRCNGSVASSTTFKTSNDHWLLEAYDTARISRPAARNTAAHRFARPNADHSHARAQVDGVWRPRDPRWRLRRRRHRGALSAAGVGSAYGRGSDDHLGAGTCGMPGTRRCGCAATPASGRSTSHCASPSARRTRRRPGHRPPVSSSGARRWPGSCRNKLAADEADVRRVSSTAPLDGRPRQRPASDP